MQLRAGRAAAEVASRAAAALVVRVAQLGQRHIRHGVLGEVEDLSGPRQLGPGPVVEAGRQVLDP